MRASPLNCQEERSSRHGHLIPVSFGARRRKSTSSTGFVKRSTMFYFVPTLMNLTFTLSTISFIMTSHVCILRLVHDRIHRCRCKREGREPPLCYYPWLEGLAWGPYTRALETHNNCMGNVSRAWFLHHDSDILCVARQCFAG